MGHTLALPHRGLSGFWLFPLFTFPKNSALHSVCRRRDPGLDGNLLWRESFLSILTVLGKKLELCISSWRWRTEELGCFRLFFVSCKYFFTGHDPGLDPRWDAKCCGEFDRSPMYSAMAWSVVAELLRPSVTGKLLRTTGQSNAHDSTSPYFVDIVNWASPYGHLGLLIGTGPVTLHLTVIKPRPIDPGSEKCTILEMVIRVARLVGIVGDPPTTWQNSHRTQADAGCPICILGLVGGYGGVMANVKWMDLTEPNWRDHPARDWWVSLVCKDLQRIYD